ncbi:MAG TPA: OmcA/MtrC family decaheme c-type cytochrome [Myxococcales bacterium]|nr:OmcA/MtrC family decaheme c-type cytochrome [Myxococcales bacterium]
MGTANGLHRAESVSTRAGSILRSQLALAALAMACAGPVGKQGPPGPPGASGDAGTPADAGTPGPSALTAETCSLCHGTGQIADAIALHKAVSATPLSRSFATIDSITIPASPPIKPTLVFTVRTSPDPASPKVTGLVSFGFTVAQLVPAATGGISNWRPVINRNYNTAADPSIGGQPESSLPTANFPAAPQATCSESSGTYTCTLGDDLSSVQPLNSSFGVVTNAFDPALTTRFGVQSNAPTPGNPATVTAGITVQPTPPFTATKDVLAGGTLADDARAEVTSAACNTCHQRLAAHGGRRLDVNYCVTCHNSSSLDNLLPAGTAPGQRNAPDPYNGTVDFKRVLHKVHMGEHLPSVAAGVPFTFHGVDFSDVAFPQMTSNGTSDPGNCTACHTLSNDANASDPGNNWRNKPGMVACASCHDRVSFAATAPAGFTLHTGGPQDDDSNCFRCHAFTSGIAPIDKVHTGLRALQDAVIGKYKFNIVSVTNTAPGQAPVVTFSVTNPANGNAPYALTEPAFTQTANGNSRLAINLAWSTNPVTTPANTNYTNDGSGQPAGQPVTIDALKNKAAGATPGTFTVTSPVPIPANAVGVGEAVMEGHPADAIITVPAPVPVRVPVPSVTRTFAITGTATTARRQVVDVNKCNKCHGNLSLHGNNRTSSIETCVGCHNANATDVSQRPASGATLDNKPEESIDFKRLIHGIHGSGFSGTGPVIYGFGGTPNDFRKAGFPGNDACRSNPGNCLQSFCEVCHNPGTYSGNFAPANGTTTLTRGSTDPSTYLRTTRITATCSACHAQKIFTDHMQQNGGAFGVTQAQIDAAQ